MCDQPPSNGDDSINNLYFDDALQHLQMTSDDNTTTVRCSMSPHIETKSTGTEVNTRTNNLTQKQMQLAATTQRSEPCL